MENADLPLSGYDASRFRIPVVENLSDEELQELNAILPWKCFVADGSGRRFGQAASAAKRAIPQGVPDRRIRNLAARVDLSEMTVLEIGCFEGVHTVALASLARHVKACDARVSNLVKTAVRCAMYQVHPTIFHWNVEKPVPAGQDVSCDVLHHVGVLYHIFDPVKHLRTLCPHVRRGIMLDTHYATPESTDASYEVAGKVYRFRTVRENGLIDPFSGMENTSKWLLLADLVELLGSLDFARIDVAEDRQERNGSRCLIIAER